MILNTEEVEEFFRKISIGSDMSEGTIVFTNGNDRYIESLIRNLLESQKTRCGSAIQIGVFCSDQKAYDRAVQLGMTACYVKIPALGVDDAYNSAGAGSELYVRLCFVKILLIKYALQLGYDVLYLDPDMAFNKDCLSELISLGSEVTFAKYIRRSDYVFVNSNIMRVYPTDRTQYIFDFVIARDLQKYLNLLPDVGDETFLTHRLLTVSNVGSSLDCTEYPSGSYSPGISPDRIKMYHANCIVGLENKINYLKSNNVWFV